VIKALKANDMLWCWQNRATNSLHNDTRLTIDLIDENDEIPQFVGLDENGRYPGSVAENLPPGAEVITVTATDKDEFPDFKKVVDQPCLHFVTTAIVCTKVTEHEKLNIF